MASIQCSICGNRIQYHSEPSGVEYIYFRKGIWTDICSRCFDRDDKQMDETGKYPKLYRSGTIEEDFRGDYYKFWKCPKCNSLYKFTEDGSVEQVYVTSDKAVAGELVEEGIVFDDYTWDRITEENIPDEKLTSIIPTYYVRKTEKGLQLSKEPLFEKVLSFSKYVPDWMNEGSTEHSEDGSV